MDNDKPQKISIGFQGGPVLSARGRAHRAQDPA